MPFRLSARLKSADSYDVVDNDDRVTKWRDIGAKDSTENDDNVAAIAAVEKRSPPTDVMVTPDVLAD